MCYCSVAQSCLTICEPTRLPCPSPSPRTCWNSYPLSHWCHSTILNHSVVPFSFCLQSFPVSGFFECIGSSYQVPKYWSFSFSIIPSNEYSGFISFTIDWFDLLAVQGFLKSLLQHHSSKHKFFSLQPMVQFSHPYMTTGENIALSIQNFVSKSYVSAFLIHCLGFT